MNAREALANNDCKAWHLRKGDVVRIFRSDGTTVDAGVIGPHAEEGPLVLPEGGFTTNLTNQPIVVVERNPYGVPQ
jgi:hypothetical protein